MLDMQNPYLAILKLYPCRAKNGSPSADGQIIYHTTMISLTRLLSFNNNWNYIFFCNPTGYRTRGE